MSESETIRLLVEALKLTQWGNRMPVHALGEGTNHIGFCPVCDQTERRGHAPDCIVDAALENAGVEP